MFQKVWQTAAVFAVNKVPVTGRVVRHGDGFFPRIIPCKTQDEVQAAHWTQEQITIHPIVCYVLQTVWDNVSSR